MTKRYVVPNTSLIIAFFFFFYIQHEEGRSGVSSQAASSRWTLSLIQGCQKILEEYGQYQKKNMCMVVQYKY